MMAGWRVASSLYASTGSMQPSDGRLTANMAMKKRHHTVNGMLIGETSNGARRGYLPDVLGSVVATVDDNGSIENLYWYKPSGALLAKMGGEPDPKFLWVGEWGYRTDATTYIRAEHYSQQLTCGFRVGGARTCRSACKKYGAL